MSPSRLQPLRKLPKVDPHLQSRLQQHSFAFVVASCREPDMPIVYASPDFYELTGYTDTDIIGKNCRFLQGPRTNRSKVNEIREAIREERTCEVCLLNYKKNGVPFYNQFYLAPILDTWGAAQFYVGLQMDVTDSVSRLPAMRANAELSQEAGDFLSHDPPRQRIDVTCPDAVEKERRQSREIREAFQGWDAVMGEQQPSSPRTLPASLLSPLLRLRHSFCLADALSPEFPLIHVSPEFLTLTGYSQEEVLGKNCRFLQGPDTSREDAELIRKAVTSQHPKPITVRMLNYKKCGTPFWNNLHIAPIRNAGGQVVFFVGVQQDVTAAPSPVGSPMSSQSSSLGKSSFSNISRCQSLPEHSELTPAQKLAQRSIVGSLRVNARALAGCPGGQAGLRRSVDFQSPLGCPTRVMRHGATADF